MRAETGREPGWSLGPPRRVLAQEGPGRRVCSPPCFPKGLCTDPGAHSAFSALRPKNSLGDLQERQPHPFCFQDPTLSGRTMAPGQKRSELGPPPPLSGSSCVSLFHHLGKDTQFHVPEPRNWPRADFPLPYQSGSRACPPHAFLL